MDELPALVVEATKKSGLIWVAVPGQPQPVGAWHLWQDTATYVVTGPGEQRIPGLDATDRCAVIVRSTDKGGRIVTWQAEVTRIEPDTQAWDDVVPAMLTKRLNADADAAQRWAAECAVLRLTPTGVLLEAGATLPADSHATPPLPSPARTPTRVPFTLHRNRAPR